MELKWLVWVCMVIALVGAALAATVSISPANPYGNNNLLCLVNGGSSGVNAHWTSTGFSGEIIANPLNNIYTRGGDAVTCKAWIPSPIGSIYAGSATITILNRAPIVSGIPDINMSEDTINTNIDLDSYVNEPDGDPVSWSAASNNPNITVIIQAGNVVRIAPSANYTGNGTITFRATDPGGMYGQQTIIVIVNPVNDPPAFNLPNNLTILEDTNGSLDLDLYANDIDSSVLTFSSLGGVNITVNIDPLTNIATFIPNLDYFGSESIIFTVTDGQYNISDNILVIVLAVNDAPIADLPDNMTADEGQNVNFSANVSDIDTAVLNYAWDFNGDSIIDSNLQNPNFIYQDNGTYLVTLIVDDGLNFVNDTMLVYVNDLNPFVNFSFNPVNPNENETVLFTDLSSASIYDAITGYAWDFDGDLIIDSNLQNPSFIYLQDGNYTITLTVFDEDSSASFSQAITINDLDPIASFIYVPLNPVEGEQVNFTDTSVSYDGIVLWSWDFDNDGAVDSNLQTPSFTFVNDGSYTVNLTIQEGDGDTSSFSAVIVVSNNPPIVDLVSSVNNGDEGLFVDFNCIVVNGNLPFNFTLDSGLNIQTLTNGISVNFNETYLNNGTYVASCSVIDNDGDFAADYENITVNDLDPDLFVSYPLALNEGENGTFNASSSTGILFEWDWNYLGVFNASDIGNNVIHAFMDNGTYTAAVRTFDGDSYNMTIFNVNILDLNPSASLTGNISINEGEYADFDASLSTSWLDNIIGYEWDFDYTGVFNIDASGAVPTISQQFNNSGNYVVAVRVLDEDSSSIATWNLTVIDSIPVAVLNSNTTNIIEGDYVNFDASLSNGFDTPLSYLFDFNDGNITLTSNPIIDHQFVQNGSYNVLLTVVDADGSNSTANVVINAADTAPNNLNIIIIPNPGIVNQTVYLNGSANAYDQPINYLWDFGDFSSGINQNDTHSYAAAGNYTVVLTAIDADGSNITGNINLEILDVLVNNAPQLFNIIPLTPATINQSEIVNFSIDVLDIDGDNLFVQWFLDTVNVQNDSYVGFGSSSFTNNFTLNGTYNIYVNVTDGFLVNDTTWIVNVLPVNGSLPNVTLSYILINEVESNPNGTDSGNEWIEIYNPTLNNIDLTNWFIQRVDNGATVNLTSIIIGPGSYYQFNTSGITLVNANLTLILYDNMSNIIDFTPVLGDAPNNDNCWARVPNGVDTNTSADWLFQLCTPGATNDILPDVNPPVVTLINPVNGFISGINNVTVQYSVTDNMDLSLDCNIYSDTSGSFVNDANQTVANGTTSNFAYLGLSDGTYLWNVLCSDSVNQAFAPANFTFTVNTSAPDITPPSIAINSPFPQTYNVTDILVDISANDASGISSIWFNYNGTDVYYTALILITFPDNSTFTLNAYANDSFGNLNSTSVVFSVNTSAPFVDTIPPVIIINLPLNQSYNVSNTLFDINVTDNVQVDSILFNYGLGNVTYNGITSLNLSDGSYTLIVYANDTSNLLATSAVTFYVNTSIVIIDTNPPIITINSPINNSLYNITNITIDITAVDLEGSNPVNISYSINSGAPIIYIAPVIGMFVDGLNNLSVWAVDNLGNLNNVNISFMINTSLPSVNNPPYFNPALIDQNAVNGTLFTYDINASDVDVGDILTYYDNTTLFNINSLTGLISFTPISTGIENITITVCDDSGAVNNCTSGSFILNISSVFVNNPPIANAGLDQINLTGVLITLNGSLSSDPDGDPLTYNWTQIAGTPVVLTGSTTVNPTFTPIVVDNYTFQLIVNDGFVDSLSDTVNVNISVIIPPNAPPNVTIINPVQGANFTNGTLINFIGNGIDLEDINITDLIWLSNIDGNFANGSNLNFVLSNGYHTITLIGFDSGGLNGTASINVNVSIAIPPNTPPTLSIPNQTLTEDIQASLNLSLYANDIDGDPLVVNVVSENASQVDCNILGSNLSFVPALNWNGIGSCVISVSDGINPPVNNAVTITVNAVNDVPNIVILNPANLSSFVQGTNINFIGGNNDVEDGPLTGIWVSSIDGVLAVSNNFNISSLSIGNHTITYTVTDSGLASNSTSIIIQITALPLLNYTIFNSTIYGIFYPMNISSDVTITSVVNSWLNNSVVQGVPVTILINANLTYAILTNVDPIINCTVIGLPGNPSLITGGSCVNTYIDPSNITQSNTTGSSITNSNISYSNVTYSTVKSSDIDSSNINGSTIINATTDNTNINNGVITNSTLVNDNIINSVIVNSNLSNMTVINANITNNIIYSGEINYTDGFINVTGPININNLPTVLLTAAPNSGTDSVISVLTATISGTFTPAFFGWDFNNDGVIDITTVIASISNTYTTSSTSRVTVNDTNGNYITDTVFITINPSSPAPSGGGGGGGSGGGGSGVCGNIGELAEKTINTRTGCIIKFIYNNIEYSLKIADVENNALILGLYDAEGNLLSDGSALLNNSIRFSLGDKDLLVGYDAVDFGDLTVTLKIVDKLKPVVSAANTGTNIVSGTKEETSEQGVAEYVENENEITGSVISRLREKVDPAGVGITLAIILIGFIFYLKMRKKD